MKSRLRLPVLLALAAILLCVPPAAAQYQYEERYDDEEGIRQTVARVSWFEGDVSFNRGDAPDDWELASTNYPMTLGDRIWAGRSGRVELQLRGATVYLGPETELAVLDLEWGVRQLALNLGTATFRVNRLDRDEVFEVATPNVSVTFETPGDYRIDVDEDGNSRVSVRQGRAWAAAAGGQVGLDRGEQIRVWGFDRPDYDVVRLARADSWDRWVEKRARRYRSIRSSSYVHPDIYGAYDLDAWGSWETHAEYGSVWYPRGVSAGWEPYRAGRWIWRDPWGWTWLSSEPWGWAPYHYGRWAVVRGRWCWVPVGPRSRYPGYAPAVVGFVGGGSGWSVSISAGGFVGWFPLGPREPFDPWWHRSRSSASITGFNYAYRNRVTVVSRDVFVRGGRVDRGVVSDARIVREVSTAPVLRGPIPVLPTRESIRVTPAGDTRRVAIRPPDRVARREVVTRTTPPPAPPTFDRKLDVIRERGGEPVPTDVSRRLAVEERRGETQVQPVRPAAREGVLLSPRGKVDESRKPQPLPPSATPARPVPGRSEVPPARVPEVRREGEPVRPAETPRRVDVPATPPVRGSAPAPRSEDWREPAPRRTEPDVRPVPATPAPAPRVEQRREPAATRVPPVPDAGPVRRDVPRPAEGGVEPRRQPVPTPRIERVEAPQPRVDRPEQKPVPSRPDVVEPRRVETRRVETAKPEPKKAGTERVDPGQGKPIPTPTPKKDERRRSDPGGGRGR